jgi:tetratricopeptide (TPR) repeat protein
MKVVLNILFLVFTTHSLWADIFNEGLELANKGNYKDAIKVFEQIVSESPENEEALFNLAYSYHMNGENSKAIWASKRLLKINPRDKDAVQLLTVAGEKMDIPTEDLKLPTGFNAFLLSVGKNTWAILSLILVTFACFIIFWGLKNQNRKIFFVLTGGIICITGFILSFFAYQSSKITHDRVSAVIINEKTFVYLNDLGERTKEIIPEGQIVEILEEGDLYTRINWHDVSGLFIKNDQLGKI